MQAFSTNQTSVAAIDFLVTEDVGARMYNSCADVKFAAMNTRAMDFIGGGATDYYREHFEFILFLSSFYILTLRSRKGSLSGSLEQAL